MYIYIYSSYIYAFQCAFVSIYIFTYIYFLELLALPFWRKRVSLAIKHGRESI